MATSTKPSLVLTASPLLLLRPVSITKKGPALFGPAHRTAL
jgi:hypothetical protein